MRLLHFASILGTLLFTVGPFTLRADTPFGSSVYTVKALPAPGAWPEHPDYVAPGGSALLEVSLGGTSNAYFENTPRQWYFNGVPIAGATQARLSLPSVTAAQAGNYFVRTTAEHGPLESNWLTLNVLPAPPPFTGPDFTSPYQRNVQGSNRFDQIYPLTDGGAIVRWSESTGHGEILTYYRLEASGQLSRGPQPIHTVGAGFPFGASQDSGNSVAAVLDNGTLLLRGSSLPGLGSAAQIGFALRQPDGKIVVQIGAKILRLNEDGTADSSFAYNSTLFRSLNSVRRDFTGRFLVTGIRGANDIRCTIVRLSATGTVDSSFTAISDVEPESEVYPVVDGGLVLRFAQNFIRYRADGSWQGASDLGLWDRMTVTAKGEVYAFKRGYGICRFLPDLSSAVDPAFSVLLDADRSVTALAVDSSGRLLAAGNLGISKSYPIIQRYDPAELPPTSPIPIVAVGILADIRPNAAVSVTTLSFGSGPFTYEWLSLDGGKLPASTTTSTLTFPSFQKENLGRYQVRVTSAGGTALGPVVDLRATTSPRLRNLSSRVQIGVGEETPIAGLTIDSPTLAPASNPHILMLRGVGPTLAQFGLRSPIPNPVLSFYDAGGVIVAQNDDWAETALLSQYTSTTGAFPLPAGSRDSLLISSSASGGYTLQLRDATNQPGVGLIEAYDTGGTQQLGSPDYSEFSNLSLRGRAGSGEATLIAGFVVHDPQGFNRRLRVLVRAVGPTLERFGVARPLPNPRLTLYSGTGAAIATADGWSTAADATQIAATARQLGAFDLPSGSKDSALIVDLAPGTYSATVTDPSGATGIALIELYRVK